MTEPEPFRCPRCGWESHNPTDKQEGYCGHCHDWTGGERDLAVVLRQLIQQLTDLRERVTQLELAVYYDPFDYPGRKTEDVEVKDDIL